jgi:hypothetical protein
MFPTPLQVAANYSERFEYPGTRIPDSIEAAIIGSSTFSSGSLPPSPIAKGIPDL